MTSSGTSELQSVEAALARASSAARFGSPAARSGSLTDDERYVQALLARAQGAMRSWENWEAINEALAGEAASAVDWLGLTALGEIRMALARDAVLTAFAISDPIKPDRLTLCRVARWLEDPELRIRASDRQWIIDRGCPVSLIGFEQEQNRKRLERLRALLVSEWSNLPTRPQPIDRQLLQLRTILRPTRDQLAHALDSRTFDQEAPSIDEIRRFVRLSLDLATDTALVWLGSAVPAENLRTDAHERARNFWRHAFAAPIDTWRSDMARRRGAGIADE